MATVSSRITIESGKRGGEPCIRGLRITFWDVLGWLGAGMTEEQILEKADFPAVYQFAADAGSSPSTAQECKMQTLAQTDWS